MFSINCNGNFYAFEKPVVMGIINLTSDSFYEGSRLSPNAKMMEKCRQMIAEGATMIDLGAQSTRPGSVRISAQMEWEKLAPAIEIIRSEFEDIIISIDTYHAKTAFRCIEAGASLINDISGGDMDSEMLATVGNLNVPYICMHMKGVPETMQINVEYENVTSEVLDYFIAKMEDCKNAGIKDVIIDPGFGFGKNISHNFKLLHDLKCFDMLQKPILAGLSRKSTIYKTLQTTADKALNGTTVLNTIALMNGASILRVHDVKEAIETINLFAAYKKVNP